MRKYTLLIIVLLQSVVVFGQAEELIKTDLPTIIPPSPTVATLMKLEEVPVNNYTGTPDISIPLFNIIGNHGLAFNMSLNYSPSSVKKEEIAGYTGLGWSLLAGGSISRTVRDIPDDAYVIANNFHTKKIGIYHNDSGYLSERNNYYDIESLLTSNFNFDRENENINRFLFETNEKHHFDSKHDLYQFNFMGYAGRFIIKKSPDGSFVVEKLDKNNLIINYNHNHRKFMINDTKGFAYLFDIKEISNTHSMSYSYKIDGSKTENLIGDSLDYISAFQLSKIFYNGELVAVFSYDNFEEEQTTRSETRNVPVLPDLQFLLNAHQVDCDPLNSTYIPNGILPLHVYNINEVSITTKKISRIKIIDRAIIDFDTQTGDRKDVNLRAPHSKPYLDKITVRTSDSTMVVKEYKFDYVFSHKLFLDEIKEGGRSSSQSLNHSFKYERLDSDYSNYDVDYWGYYRYKDYDPACVNIENINRDTDKVSCKKDVLKQIIYPTKGSAIFEFESNTYSYIGDYEILDSNADGYFDDFTNNPDNTSITNLDTIVLTNDPNDQIGSVTHDLGVFTSDRSFVFNSYFTGVDDNHLGFLHLKGTKVSNPSEDPVDMGILTFGCPLDVKLKGGYSYYIKFDWSVGPPHAVAAIISIDEKIKNEETKRWLYGGGIRIKNIYYTDNDPQELTTQSYPDTYSRRIGYNYNFFNVDSRSSGSLAFQKPKMRYQAKRVFNHLAGDGNCHVLNTHEIEYEVYSSSNNLSCISTKGSDVGYKNVTVTETGNGKTEFEYISPIDWPEDMNSRSVAYPFAPTPNIDYKRGLLTKVKKYDSNSRILQEKEDHYEFEDHIVTTGFTIFPLFPDCPYAGMFDNYDHYRSGVLDPTTYPTGVYLPNGLQIIAGSILNWNARNCGEFVSEFASYYPLKEAFGWAKLEHTLSKDYFYDSNNERSFVENNVSYRYNPNNMQLNRQASRTSTDDEIVKKYYYTIDPEVETEPEITVLRNKNMVDLPIKTETFKNGEKLSEQKTIYKDWENGLLAPAIVQVSKGNFPLENRIRYKKIDNTNGNPLEVQKENGMVISYIWGYNKTQPIAKIENIDYDTIPANLITALQNASDTGTEANLIAMLSELRHSPDLANAMVTTYTYIPLVGVSTVTDPKGYTTTYEYDNFGRLRVVRDAYGNKLSENEYNYRTQN